MNRVSFSIMVFLAVASVLDPLYLGLYFVSAVALVAAVYVRRSVRRRFAVRPPAVVRGFEPRVFGVRRMRRFARRANVDSARVLESLPTKKLLVCFATVALAALLIGLVIGVSLVQYRLSGSGNIHLPPKLGVYADADCMVPMVNVDFGTFSPGDTVNRTIYLRNEGGFTGSYSLATADWDPAVAESFVELTWSYAGQDVMPGSVVEVELRLHASSTLTSDSGISAFSFTAVITLEASEVQV